MDEFDVLGLDIWHPIGFLPRAIAYYLKRKRLACHDERFVLLGMAVVGVLSWQVHETGVHFYGHVVGVPIGVVNFVNYCLLRIVDVDPIVHH